VRHVQRQQADPAGGQGEPDDRDRPGPEPVGEPAGDEHARDAAEVDHQQEADRGAEVVPLPSGLCLGQQEVSDSGSGHPRPFRPGSEGVRSCIG